ncbi:hypothetical protein Mapa_014565 [Marchantia paleacea]|nr:hypothetical protein Mapa_014565 [Marchantia paleacea]
MLRRDHDNATRARRGFFWRATGSSVARLRDGDGVVGQSLIRRLHSVVLRCSMIVARGAREVEHSPANPDQLVQVGGENDVDHREDEKRPAEALGERDGGADQGTEDRRGDGEEDEQEHGRPPLAVQDVLGPPEGGQSVGLLEAGDPVGDLEHEVDDEDGDQEDETDDGHEDGEERGLVGAGNGQFEDHDEDDEHQHGREDQQKVHEARDEEPLPQAGHALHRLAEGQVLAVDNASHRVVNGRGHDESEEEAQEDQDDDGEHSEPLVQIHVHPLVQIRVQPLLQMHDRTSKPNDRGRRRWRDIGVKFVDDFVLEVLIYVDEDGER